MQTTLTWAGRFNAARDWPTTHSSAKRLPTRSMLGQWAVRVRPETLLRTATDIRRSDCRAPTDSAVTVTLGSFIP